MRPADLERLLADKLLSRPGWRRHERRPHSFVHADTSIQVILFDGSLTITLGRDAHDSDDKGLSTKSTLFPSAALEVILETVDALVLKRTIDSRRLRPRKGGIGLPAGDMLLLLCAQLGSVSSGEAVADPQWTLLGGWRKNPAISTITRAVYELRGAGLIDTGWGDGRARLTPQGWREAAEIAARAGVTLPDPVAAG